jgi:hypothetical protein
MIVTSRFLIRHKPKNCFCRFLSDSEGTTWDSLRERYRTDPQRILTYNDPLVHNSYGRVFKCDSKLLPVNDPLVFPKISGWNLKDPELVKIPDQMEGGIKIVSVSLRGGLDYIHSWVDPVEEKFHGDQRVFKFYL